MLKTYGAHVEEGWTADAVEDTALATVKVCTGGGSGDWGAAPDEEALHGVAEAAEEGVGETRGQEVEGVHGCGGCWW